MEINPKAIDVAKNEYKRYSKLEKLDRIEELSSYI